MGCDRRSTCNCKLIYVEQHRNVQLRLGVHLLMKDHNSGDVKMVIKVLQSTIILMISLMTAVTLSEAQTERKTLDDSDNPLLIGKRDINKHQINFYSLDKEIALGRQLAAEVDHESKLVTDPIV